MPGLVFVLAMLPLSAARAFSDPTYYGKYPTEIWGGGGGRFFTGSPADGYDCSVCHTSTPTYSFPLNVTSLPVDGYVAGKEYKVKVSWPIAANSERASIAQGNHPLTLMTAELLAENGSSSGTLQLASEVLAVNGADTCTPKPEDMGAPAPLAASIYQTSKSGETVEITDRKKVCSTGGDEEKRCVLALKQCIPGPGASQLQFTWTAPPQWSGPIWFSAGFVSTYNADGIPNDADFVTALSIPMNPKSDGSTYETKLDGGCSVTSHGKSRAASPWLFAFFVAALTLMRRRRSWLRVAVALSVAAIGGGCTQKTSGNQVDKPDVVGRYEPGTLVDGGYDAGKMECQGVDIPSPADSAAGASAGAGGAVTTYANAGNGASGTSGITGASGASGASGITGASGMSGASGAGGSAGSATAGMGKGGKLTLTYTPMPPPGVTMGYWDRPPLKPSYGVVWIEDAMGRFVKTLEFWGMTIYIQANLHDYLGKRTYCPVDVVAQATHFDYSPHTTTWDGKSSKGFVVPDGPYVLWIDIQIDERNPMPSYRIDFMKGSDAITITPPPMAPQTGTTLTYTPPN